MLPNLKINCFYGGYGEDIKNDFYLPVLENSTSYRRLSAYFSIQSLVNVAEGIECMMKKKGSIKLVLGYHDIPRELLKAKLSQDIWNKKLIDSFKSNILDGISSLTDEISKNRVAVFALMLADGFLKVKIANPKNQRGGIFHDKKQIFGDEEGNIVVATGSANESANAFGPSYESLTVFKSWDEYDTRHYIETHEHDFERIWNGQKEELQINNLDKTFAREMLNRLEDFSSTKLPVKENVDKTAENVMSFIRESPSFAPLNVGNVAMFPHQERVYKEVLSRWPVRALIADEVGLGKTIEAGSIISEMIKLKCVKKILILTPAHVMKQWQEEMSVHFNLNFSIYDSTNRKFIDAEEKITYNSNKNPLDNAPDLCIASVYLARGSKARPHLLNNLEKYPGLLVVDEAHSARINSAMSGGPTLIWKMLNDVKDKIPHLLLLTATPLQVHWEEFHGILKLLGLSETYEDEGAYFRSLAVLSKKAKTIGYPEASVIRNNIADTHVHYSWKCPNYFPEEFELFSSITDERENFDHTEDILASKTNAMKLFLRAHPAQILTVRNSRGSLAKLGYKFPSRDIEAPEIPTDSTVQQFYHLVDTYLKDTYGQYRQALYPDSKISLGYVKTVFYQRIVSSLYAARLTLQRKATQLDSIVSQVDNIISRSAKSLTENWQYNWTDYEDGNIEFELHGKKVEVSDKINWEQVRRLAKIERIYLKEDLLPLLDKMGVKDPMSDPKITELINILDKHLVKDKAIVFSHYTDTLEACMKAFVSNSKLDDIPDFGYYTGSDVWIKQGHAKFKCSKMDIQNALRNGTIKVLFCSDAASEGINLQAARVLINIDVPWNPSKLEQRIGRIARIGQKADVVKIVKLWYPGSIESDMYGRLMERKELYELAVGELADIFGKNIQEHVKSKFTGGGNYMDEVLDELQNMRQKEQLSAISKIWGAPFDLSPTSKKLRAEILVLLQKNINGVEIKGKEDNLVLVDAEENIVTTSVPGEPESLSFQNKIMDSFTLQDNKHQKYLDLKVIKSNDTKLALCLSEGDDLLLLTNEQLPLILKSFSGKSIDTSKLERVNKQNYQDLQKFIKKNMIWLPNFDKVRFPGFDNLQKQPLSYEQSFTFEQFGQIGVI